MHALMGSSFTAWLLPVLHCAQDVYRRLSEPCALAGLLRLRASPEFRIARAYGHLAPDARYDNLHHVIAAGPGSSFAFDFEYAGAAGLSPERGGAPFLQMVFQYSTLAPSLAHAHGDSGGGAGEGNGDGAAAAPAGRPRCFCIATP